ncbi:MAG: SWIM zinc finger family protein [Nanoarchaeota archaeon]|nr:SWIM zinc finger family protein [Nanoarchaeota archaeon]
MDSIKDITKEDIEELFDGNIFSKGEEYFEEGLVESIELLDNTTIMGVVVGNERYKVTISLESEGDIICDCTCPCEFNCKHSAALLLKWISEKEEFSGKKKPDGATDKEDKFSREPIEKIISDKDKEELVTLVAEMIRRNPELKSLIVLRKNEIVQKIRIIFSRYWDWNEIRELISELELILNGIKKSKSLWGKKLLEEIEKASGIIIHGMDSVHDDEGAISDFLEEWYELYGKIFATTNPSKEEKIEFIKKILKLMEKDEYGMEESYEKSFLGMCKNLGDVELIKEYYKKDENVKEEEDSYDDADDYDQFYLELYEKIGANEKFLELSRDKCFSLDTIDKLIQLERFEEALKECEKQKEFSEDIENRKIVLLKRFGRDKEAKELLFNLAKKIGEISYAKKLKNECKNDEWKEYLRKLLDAAKKNKWNEFVSRIYFNEEDYKNAYEYGQDLSDAEYLELLAKKLSKIYPDYSCQILRRFCFENISHGSGWPYKKAGQLLKEIKKIDSAGSFYKKTKKEVILKHKKKYSLMEIIEKI